MRLKRCHQAICGTGFNTGKAAKKKKNDEFTEAQKTFKEQAENQVKTFTEQLKVRNEEVEKLKKIFQKNMANK